MPASNLPSAPTPGNVVIGQSGGPTAVINQTLIGVAKEALRHPQTFKKVYGAIHGIQGILDGNFCDFAEEDPANLEIVAGTPSAALKSVRLKPTPQICAQVLARFKEHDVRYFFYIGGNDTAETAHIINEMAIADGYQLTCIHCPKTIDNDLRVTDHCPGYGSAAKFVAQAFMGDNLDNRSLGGIKINVVMGRNAGWLTAASALARQFPDDGPHLIYCPETDFSMQQFGSDVLKVSQKLGRCVIAVSEGIHGIGGADIINLGETDSHGNKQLSGSGALGDYLAAQLKNFLGKAQPGVKHRIRADTFGYLQRCFPGVVSEVDAREARQAGTAAVEAAIAGTTSGSVAFRRIGDGAAYAIETFITPLHTVAKETKHMPRELLNAAGNDVVMEKLMPYLKPLVGTLPAIGRLAMVGAKKA
ncbi:MAG: 6-phosphofructokinase [Planctomycetes bacterium]|jgi:6-phosphofructokinase 1|nr:6-phosphofructokinase [Planctomycetota bacterium]